MTGQVRSSALWFIVLAVVLSLFVPVQAVSPLAPQNGTVTISPGDPIQIAVTVCSAFVTYQDHLDAAQMALDDYGSIHGFSLQRNDYDTLCDPTSGANAADTIVANAQHVGVIGPIYSSSTFGAAPKFETAGLVMISHANTNATLPTVAPNVFNRVTIPDPGGDGWAARVNTLPSAVSWRTDFATEYGRTPDDLAVLAYDATSLLLARIDEVSTVDGGGNLVIDRAALAAAVRNTANWAGASGLISLEVNGDRVNSSETSVWSDQFTSTSLTLPWTWIDEDVTHWSLTAAPGSMRLTTQQQEKNRLVRDLPRGDFEIRTRVLFEPAENFQIAGLYIFGDENNLLKLGRAYCNLAPPTGVGNGVYFDHLEGGSSVGSNYAMTTTVESEAYLRIVSDGSNLTGYVSTNGTQWTEVGTHTIGFTPTKIGLTAGNQGQPVGEIPADFDFFVVEYDTYRVHMPVITRMAGP